MFYLFLIKSKKELKLAPVYSVFYHFCFLPSFPTAIYFFCFMGERRLTGVLSTPTMSLRLQVPMLSGTRTMASTLGIQQMLMPACVMLVRNQIEWHNSPLLTVTIGSVVPRGTCTARRCAFPEWLEVASGDAWCLMSKLVSCNVQRNFSRTCLNIRSLFGLIQTLYKRILHSSV